MTEIPSSWAFTSVGESAGVQGGIQKQPKRKPVANFHPFLRVANVLRGRLDLDEVHNVELFDGELERFKLQPGDLLVVEGNGSPEQIGRAASWNGQIADCVHQNHLIRVRPSAALDPRFLELAWSSPRVAAQLRSVASSTSGLYTLSTAKIKAIELPVAPLAEQRRIVDALDDHLSRLDAAAESLSAAVVRSRALNKSRVSQILNSLDCASTTMSELSTSIGYGTSTKCAYDAKAWLWLGYLTS